MRTFCQLVSITCITDERRQQGHMQEREDISCIKRITNAKSMDIAT